MKILDFLFAFSDSKKIIFVDSEEGFQLFIQEIIIEKEIAVDTEFTWRDTYFPILNLIQVATEKKIYLIDCSKLRDLKDLSQIFSSNKIVKVLHSLRGDVTVLFFNQGLTLFNVFDTQIAESLISNEKSLQISYKNLVKKYLLFDLGKKETNSNWGKRPLSESQINYAADDVRHLLRIKKNQEKKINKLKLKEELHSCANKEKLLGEKNFLEARLERHTKKYRNISREEIEIFKWRENQAKLTNSTPNKIFNDKNLKLIVKNLKLPQKRNEYNWLIPKKEIREDFLSKFV